MKMKKTIKSQVLDFVQANGGKMRRTDIIRFVVEKIHKSHYNPIRDRGEYCGAFQVNYLGKGAYFLKPSKNDPRYLTKESDGYYHLCK